MYTEVVSLWIKFCTNISIALTGPPYLVPIWVITVDPLCEVIVSSDEVLNLRAHLRVVCAVVSHGVLPLHQHEWSSEVGLHHSCQVGHLLVQHLHSRVGGSKVNNLQSGPAVQYNMGVCLGVITLTTAVFNRQSRVTVHNIYNERPLSES